MKTPPPPRIKTVAGKTYHVCEWRDESGKKRSKSFGPTSKVSDAQASLAYRNWLIELYAEPGGPARKMDVRTLCATYLTWAKRYYRHPDGTPTREAQNLWDALDPLGTLCGDMPAESLRPRHAEAYQAELIKRKLARTTINKRMAGVRRMLRWAVAKDVVPPETLAGFSAVAPLKPGRSRASEPEAVRAVAWSTVEATLPHCPPTLASMVRLQWLTGMRPGELCRMTPADLDTTSEPWTYTLTRHKTSYRGGAKRIYLGPAARALIEPLLRRSMHEPVFSPAEAQKQRERIKRESYRPPEKATGDYRRWASYKARRHKPRVRYRDRYDTQSYRQAVHYACDAAGVPRWNPNQLRHAAKDRLEREHGIEAASVMLGHAKLETTQMYGERDARRAAKLAERTG